MILPFVRTASRNNQPVGKRIDGRISCEAESDLLWLQVEGYPHAYNLRLILNTGRCAGVTGLLRFQVWCRSNAQDFLNLLSCPKHCVNIDILVGA